MHLPGEAALAVAASLLGRQHEGIGPAGKQQLPDLEGFGDPEPSPSAWAVEPLQPLDAARHDSVLPEMTRHPRGGHRQQGGTAGQSVGAPHPQGPRGRGGMVLGGTLSPQ